MRRALFIIGAMLMFTTMTFAQSRTSKSTLDSFANVPYEHTFKMTGTELFKGTYDPMDNKCWGNTFMIDGSDIATQAQGQFSYTMDYVAGDPDPKNGNQITHGTWALAVFDNGRYAGTIFGEFQNGSLTWELFDNGTVATGYLNAKVIVVGGTGDYASVNPLNGSLEAITSYAGKTPVTGAMLNLTF